jgi:hypothetical protein
VRLDVCIVAALLGWLAFAGAAGAQIVLDPVEVIGVRPAATLGTAETASEGQVSRERIEARPVYRPGEVLETVPGLIITQHSGEGKANQYFLRGFNLDHGTDFAIYVDGMPINMPTHGHGQGYADINWLMPELLGGVVYRKGPYFADEGDFSSAGAAHIELRDSLDRDFVTLTGGSFGYARSLGATSKPMEDGNLIAAAEIGHYDGPWRHPDDLQKLNGLVRYTRGTPDDGFSITGLAYGARWYSTDQIPQRAVTEGLIDRFGAIDPTDGGTIQRYSLSARWAERQGDTVTRANAYLIASDLRLYNDFTYFLRDPVNGDQFKQSDRRFVFGGALGRTYEHRLFGDGAETTIGLQTRYDRIDVGLFNTAERSILSVVRDDMVDEASVGLYGQNTVHWTPWLRTNLGLRGDVFYGNDHSDLAANSGSLARGIASPKAGIVFGPFSDAEFYANAGTGYHSNDVRGTTIRIDPTDQITRLRRVPLLVRSKGAEIGARIAVADTLQASAALFVLDFDSELVFSGDAGTTEASRPSRRVGGEINALYQPLSWLVLDVDAAYSRARFTNSDPVGDRIPGAATSVVSAGAQLDKLGPYFGAIQLRYFGRRPLIEDNSVTSKPTLLLSARAGYRLTDGVELRLDIFNLLGSTAHQIDYFYASRLPGEPPDGVNDVHFHPVEPTSVRASIAVKL